jgi:hypothetical protein
VKADVDDASSFSLAVAGALDDAPVMRGAE